MSYRQAERLIDTEISYVLNKANLEQYRRLSVGKVTIVNLDVNTCEKCKALEGQVFRIDDAPVLPIHPRCHCSYCVPAEGDDAEVTASGADLDRVYADVGVKGYERVPAGDVRKITFSMSEIRSAPETVRVTAAERPQAPAVPAAVSSSPAIARPETEAAKTAGNTGLSSVSGLRDEVESGTIETGESSRNRVFNPGDFKTEAEVKTWIKSPGRILDILPGQQNKHLEGTREYQQEQKRYKKKGEYGPSRVTIDGEAIAALVRRVAGSGIPEFDKKGCWTGKELIVDHDEVVGVVVNNLNGKEKETTVFKIHYTADGAHIVPDYPSKKNRRR